MAVKKRAKKNKRAARKRGQRKPSRRSPLRTLLAASLLAIAAVSASYYFGSFELRRQLQHAAIHALNMVRGPEFMPRAVVTALNTVYDSIPGSAGLEVEGGELGYEDSPLLAGVPLSQAPVRVLRNQSYINLYDEQLRQSRCVAFKLEAAARQPAAVPQQFVADPRIPNRHVGELPRGPWQAQPMAPAAALGQAFGSAAAKEAHLVTNLVPMPHNLQALWQRLMHELTVHYPKRFGEIWIYAGPIPQPHGARLASGIAAADSFYAIAFDLTETGGLRAIAFHLPVDAEDAPLRNYLSSIERIEQLSGLQFLPEVDYHARSVLSSAVNAQLW
jgi:endonuclease G